MGESKPGLEWKEVRLPSWGRLYLKDDGESQVPDGKIKIRKLMSNEDAILLSQGIEGLERLNKIIDNCTNLPNGFPPNQLLVTDRMAILLALRLFTFRTPNYRYDYRCTHCGGTSPATVDLIEDLPERNPETIAHELWQAGKIEDPKDFVLKEPLEVELPDAGYTVTVRFLRGEDETKIRNMGNRVQMQSNDPSDPSYRYRLALQLVEINGEKENRQRREMFAQGMTSLDTTVLSNRVDEVEPGLDLKVYPHCGKCGGQSKMVMPFTAEFFRPSDV
jgi:hypothetical protein